MIRTNGISGSFINFGRLRTIGLRQARHVAKLAQPGTPRLWEESPVFIARAAIIDPTGWGLFACRFGGGVRYEDAGRATPLEA